MKHKNKSFGKWLNEVLKSLFSEGIIEVLINFKLIMICVVYLLHEEKDIIQIQ